MGHAAPGGLRGATGATVVTIFVELTFEMLASFTITPRGLGRRVPVASQRKIARRCAALVGKW